MKKRKFVVSMVVLLLVLLMVPQAFAVSYEPGKAAYSYMKELSEDSRVAGTAGEFEAKEYIISSFKDMGYLPSIQRFSFNRGNRAFSSSNVIVEKPGRSSKVIIVGAHYDSVKEGRGCDDNASGVAVMMEAAKVLKNATTPYTIRFVAFGAEEDGYFGSQYYVSQMTRREIENTVAMINLDSLAVGDHIYVYGGTTEKDRAGWVRDQILAVSEKEKVDLQTNPGLNPEYPAGTTGLWSDHAAFVEKGIPYAYLEATNWALGDMDGYTQTEQDGGIWHTKNDNLEYIEANYPGRIQDHLVGFSKVLVEFLESAKEIGLRK